jgi:hypothetical protein
MSLSVSLSPASFSLSVSVCVCVCVRERERETHTHTERPAAFNLVAINGQSGYKSWPKANSGQIPYSEGAGLARYGHVEWRKEVAYSHHMATDFAKKDKI